MRVVIALEIDMIKQEIYGYQANIQFVIFI